MPLLETGAILDAPGRQDPAVSSPRTQPQKPLPDSWPGRSMVRPTFTAPGSKGWLGERGLKEWLTVGR
jgi:hypothetical protein